MFQHADAVAGPPQPNRIRRALEAAGVEFIVENGGGPGVRLRDRRVTKSGSA